MFTACSAPDHHGLLQARGPGWYNAANLIYGAITLHQMPGTINFMNNARSRVRQNRPSWIFETAVVSCGAVETRHNRAQFTMHLWPSI